ncbi:glycosyltransferase family 4 protein [Halomonas sp. MCCC 1A17488]|nr:glycosyltransferase family 4 protein [Halomonas sp. MCCC 1A17488]MCG3238169.1 glycosyltransferase family 4 protein [Halomonas sp. MCCC 1A17488]
MSGSMRGMGRFAWQLIRPVRDQVMALSPAGTRVEGLQSVESGRGFFPLWEQYHLPRLVRQRKPDILLCPYNTGPLWRVKTPTLVVVHDLIFMRSWKELPPSRSFYQTLGRYYRRRVVPRMVRKAQHIITVSKYTRRELIDKLGVAASNVTVIPNAIGDEWFREEPLPLENRQPYLFTVAGEAPSKNVPALIAAFAQARQKALLSRDITLVIGGIPSARHDYYRHLSRSEGLVDDDVTFEGYLTVEELKDRYRLARGFVFASLFEGFGIPPLEALASGTPVACSNTTSLPEVVGEHARLFDPSDIQDMAMSMATLCNDSDALDFERRVQAGRGHARAFSESSVEKTITRFWERFQC